FTDFGLRPGTGTAAPEALIVVVGVTLWLFLSVNDSTDLLTSITNPGISQYLLLEQKWWVLVLCLTAGGFFLPLVEETFYRGMCLAALESAGWNRFFSLCLSAGIMALVQPASYMTAAFFQSLLCAWWYQRSGSVIPGLLLRGGLTVILMMHYCLFSLK
ncbi:MAG TPA: CPBP family intramembrane metalloprotease, partial [Candidatus Ozemobacteraceae bacterium]|nr:CPBP family intramembrane metalloprotease [Candidatus Ozemobacteraceae bacterium]